MNFAVLNVVRCLRLFPAMRNKFELALMDYGSQVMTAIFQYALKSERYEDCAVIKTLFEKYHLDLNQTVEKYQEHFWEMGLSGRIAVASLNQYLKEALILVGYPADAIRITHCTPI